MVHEPLILSDTAMVLLQRYVEIDDDYQTINAQAVNYPERLDKSFYRTRHDLLPIRGRIGDELLSDIWFLWAFPDVSVMRHLNWHFVLTDLLMRLITKVSLSPLEQSERIRAQVEHDELTRARGDDMTTFPAGMLLYHGMRDIFLETLVDDYRRELARRKTLSIQRSSL
jgi:hypothetical protein